MTNSNGTNEMAKKSPVAAVLEWAAIFLLIIIVLPLGLFLMFRKAGYEKMRYYDNGRKMMFIGAALTAFTIPVILLFSLAGAGSFKTLITYIGIPSLYAAAGAVAFIAGFIYTRKGRSAERYLEYIVIDKITNIDAIAEKDGVSYEAAASVIQRLIDKGLLPGSYVYEQDREVIVPGISTRFAFRCKNCGETTVIDADGKNECVHCGSPLL